MSASVADVLAQLRELLGVIDQAAVAALRVQTDARHAQTAYQEVGTGTANTDINQAITLTRAAGEKAGRVAQLLAAAATAYADYINTIAPGTAPTRHSAPEAMPTGEELLAGAGERNSRFDSWLRRTSGRADDVQDGLSETTKNVSDGTKAIGEAVRHRIDPHPSGQATTTGSHHEEVRPADNPANAPQDAGALVVSAVALTVAGKAIKNYWKKRTRGSSEST
jgi:hypothetical protein